MFVRGSIDAVVHTLFEAILLVVLVVILFLQTWRASIIPLVAVPVSLIGTFAVMHLFGFSLNALSLFGLVLAIGIVVDDAIVVVENVERNIARGLSPLDATRQAMSEVTGPIVATALVLCAVFVPTAFISGLTGQFYKQFALTIAISHGDLRIQLPHALPGALGAAAARARRAARPADPRCLDGALGWLFRPFNRFFDARIARLRARRRPGAARRRIVLLVYAGLIALTCVGFAARPTGFVPTQDKQYLVAFAQLPDAASLDRTEAVIRRMGDIALKQPGVESAVAFPGLSINGFTNSPNSGIVFVTLKPFEERTAQDLSAAAIAQALNGQYGEIQDAFIAVFPPPPVKGLGTIGGFRLQVEDRGRPRLRRTRTRRPRTSSPRARGRPELAGLFTSYQVNVPQVDADVDREKAKSQGVALQDVFDTMQIYLGSLYVNDFNRFGRTYQVNVQAEPRFRLHAEDIARLKTRNANGDMIPLGSFVTVLPSSGPDRVMHYNGYPTAEINGGPAPGYSTGQAQAAIETLARKEPAERHELRVDRADLPADPRRQHRDHRLPARACCSSSWCSPLSTKACGLPLAVILIVPMVLFSAITGVHLSGGDNNIFTQIGLIVLVGLACKNAILIVEFARDARGARAAHSATPCWKRHACGCARS